MSPRRLAWLIALPIAAILAAIGGALLLVAVLLRGALDPDSD